MKKSLLIIYGLAAMVATACRSDVEPVVVTGYIAAGSDDTAIIISHPDSLLPVRIAITDATTISGGELVAGNIAEVIYVPTEEKKGVVLPKALQITADKTFPRALGRWASREDQRPKIDIELLADGTIKQFSPTDILTYSSWRLTGEEDMIELRGTLSLPPERKKEKKKTASDAELTPPSRRLKSFCVTAEIGIDGNRRTLIITSTKSRKAKLYFVEEQ